MNEPQVNPDYVDAPYEAHGWERDKQTREIVWFTDKEVARDPQLGIKVERRAQDTGRLLLTYILPLSVGEREASRPAKSIRFYKEKRRKKLKNCVPFHQDRDSFEMLPNAIKDSKRL